MTEKIRLQDLFFALLRFELLGEELTPQVKEALTVERIQQLYVLSKKHDLAHLVGDALHRHKFLAENSEQKKLFTKERYMAVYRYEQSEYEFQEIVRVLEDLKLPFIPLKGMILRELYPEPWMRTSCDIDIFVHSENVAKAERALVERLGYTSEGKISHDLQMVSSNGVHFELHYELIEAFLNAPVATVLENVWEQTDAYAENSMRRVMKDETFYFYHVAHMAKHFENGGCGVRPFLDLWILDRQLTGNEEKREEMIERGGLTKFLKAARALMNVWLAGAEHTELTKNLEAYILHGGVYGTHENKLAVQRVKKGGKFRYALSVIFLPYAKLKLKYPVLEKHKWLFPFMSVWRWICAPFGGKIKKNLQNVEEHGAVSEKTQTETDQLLREIGLR